MIKVLLDAVEDGHPMLVLGITNQNMRDLVNGGICYMDLTQFGVNTEIVIMCGETDTEVIDELKRAVGAREAVVVPPESHTDATEPETAEDTRHG